jgi:integrase
MRQSREEGLHNNNEFERKSFKSLREPVQNIYLTESELKKIYELDLSKDKVLEVVRDIFLIGCYTALRFSDYSRITPNNISTLENGKMVIILFQQKTGEKVIIPVRHELKVILKRYGYNPPKTYEQKVNRYIKLIGRMAGITEMVRVEANRGGMTIKKDLQKNGLIVTHTARRSGCTNMYLAGIPVIDIMKISGHKSESQFLKYIKVSKEETALNLSDHPYFIGNTLSIAR